MITTYEEAKQWLTTAALDVEADFGSQAVDDAWSDLVKVTCSNCTPEVAAELARREGVQL
jgi:hypothetical protein